MRGLSSHSLCTGKIKLKGPVMKELGDLLSLIGFVGLFEFLHAFL